MAFSQKAASENNNIHSAANQLWKAQRINKSNIVNLRGAARIQYLRPFNEAVEAELQARFPDIPKNRIRARSSAAFRSVWMK